MQPERTIRMITSQYEEALDKIKWMETGLEQLIKRYPNDMELGGRIRTFFQSLSDGEPTTADEHNYVYISDINKEIAEDWDKAAGEVLSKNYKADEKEHVCRHGIHRSKRCVKCDEFAEKFSGNIIQSIGYRGED